MLLDFDIQRCTRQCTATDRKLAPGETFYSVLEVHGADVIRRDFSKDAWQGPPEAAFAWWKSRIPEPAANKAKLAPNEVLLELFDQLVEQPDNADMLYVLSLLLIRRRVFRECAPAEEAGQGDGTSLSVHCPRRDETYHLAVVTPSESRIDEIQQELAELLFADAK